MGLAEGVFGLLELEGLTASAAWLGSEVGWSGSLAESDGDAIYAVIRGSGVNYDGKTNGITAPNGVAQTELLKEVDDDEMAAPIGSEAEVLREDSLPEALPGFDLTAGLKRLQGNRRLYIKLLRNFISNSNVTAGDIRKALNAKDLDQAHSLVHNLKGVAGNLAATELHAAAVSMERLIKQWKNSKLPTRDELDSN